MGSTPQGAISPNDKFVKYSFRPEDIEVGAERLIPKHLPEGSGMKRVATPSDRSLRAGFTKFRPGHKGKPVFFWYKEIWYIIAGMAEIKMSDKRTGEQQIVRVKAGDLLYYPEGIRIETTNIGNEEFLFLYCAVPASNRYESWLPLMDEEDMGGVRRRDESGRSHKVP